MKILLIEPPKSPVTIGGEDLHLFEPLALEYLAAGLVDHHDVAILDMRIDPDLDREIRKRARATGKSLNRVVLEMIRGGPGARAGRAPGESLVSLSGGWSEEEARAFEESIRSCEQIDEGMWR